MSNDPIIFQAITGLALFCGCAWLYLAKYRETQIEKFRQELFALRDELFDYASDGNVSFTHPAYCLLRKMINAHIRHSSGMSAIRFFVLVATMKRLRIKETPFSETLGHELRDLPAPVQKAILEINRRMTQTLIFHAAKMSPVATVVIIIAASARFSPMERRVEIVGSSIYHLDNQHATA